MVLVVLAGVVLVGSVVAVAYVASGGKIPIPFSNPQRFFTLGKETEDKPWTPPVGKVAIPTAARTVAAYAEVTIQDFWSAKQNRLTCAYVDPKSVQEQKDDAVITDLTQITGRVLRYEVPTGHVFRERDFMPVGTRPGLVAGVPPGYRGKRIELSKVRGLYDLKAGDCFDLVSTIPVAGDASQDLRKLGGAYGDQLAIQASFANVSKQATVRVIVQCGLVVSPVQTIEVPVTMASLTQGTKVNSKPLQEVYIAVHPEEIAPLEEALAVGADLAVVTRSGRPEDDKSIKTPERRPHNPFTGGDGEEGLTFVEKIGGTNKERVPVPTSSDSKEPVPDDKK
jgi:hypothetical protein